jgi:cardiolipin synthase
MRNVFLSRRMLVRLIKRMFAAIFALQATVIGTLVAIDAWRKRGRPQGKFPHRSFPSEIVGESEVHVYVYGEDLYADMLEAIRNARERVFFETFIWKGDKIGQQFKDELYRAAERGVAVYAIYDSFANMVVPHRFKQFAPGIHVLKYPNDPRPWRYVRLRNLARNHRKTLTVDSNVAFVGGYNIGARYATEWRDTHVRITGPDAWEIENTFVDFWNNHRGYLPAIPEHGARTWDPKISVHRNDPQMLTFPIRSTYLEAIDRAQHHIYITQAYFIPDRIIRQALLAAAKRGVDVQIVLPATSNHIVADWLARGQYTHYLQGGIKLLLYQNAMVHAKTATMDGMWSTIGTANVDRLSLLGNFEVNVEFYNRDVALQMEQIFATDVSNTHELTLKEWLRRPFYVKLSEAILSPLWPLL